MAYMIVPVKIPSSAMDTQDTKIIDALQTTPSSAENVSSSFVSSNPLIPTSKALSDSISGIFGLLNFGQSRMLRSRKNGDIISDSNTNDESKSNAGVEIQIRRAMDAEGSEEVQRHKFISGLNRP